MSSVEQSLLIRIEHLLSITKKLNFLVFARIKSCKLIMKSNFLSLFLRGEAALCSRKSTV